MVRQVEGGIDQEAAFAFGIGLALGNQGIEQRSDSGNRAVHGLELLDRRLVVFAFVFQQRLREQRLLAAKGVVEAALVDLHGGSVRSEIDVGS